MRASVPGNPFVRSPIRVRGIHTGSTARLPAEENPARCAARPGIISGMTERHEPEWVTLFSFPNVAGAPRPGRLITL
ncbi:hypothetical protein GCM10010440_58770 [Kitasatospora cinereorecta]